MPRAVVYTTRPPARSTCGTGRPRQQPVADRSIITTGLREVDKRKHQKAAAENTSLLRQRLMDVNEPP
ncbi:hypothetical protein E0J16_06325 [Rhizobium pisi]|nr:hypothetical protein ELG97_36430 [Rhizobium leguminosarum]TCA61206.1 hypothetical protein E0J16_06325 [Rhizobium pisi]